MKEDKMFKLIARAHDLEKIVEDAMHTASDREGTSNMREFSISINARDAFDLWRITRDYASLLERSERNRINYIHNMSKAVEAMINASSVLRDESKEILAIQQAYLEDIRND